MLCYINSCLQTSIQPLSWYKASINCEQINNYADVEASFLCYLKVTEPDTPTVRHWSFSASLRASAFREAGYATETVTVPMAVTNSQAVAMERPIRVRLTSTGAVTAAAFRFPGSVTVSSTVTTEKTRNHAVREHLDLGSLVGSWVFGWVLSWTRQGFGLDTHWPRMVNL